MDDDTSGLVDPAILETDGKQFAYQAVEYDKTGNYPMAVFYYNVRIIQRTSILFYWHQTLMQLTMSE